MDRREGRARRNGRSPALVAGFLLCLGWLLPGEAQAVSFSPQQAYPAGDGPSAIAIGHLQGNSGFSDVAVANSASDNVTVAAGDGTGAFSVVSTVTAGKAPSGVAIADFDGDLDSDLAVSNAGSDNVSILLGNSTGSFSPGATVAVGDSPRSVTVANLNGDADPDLVIANAGTDNVSIVLGSTGATFAAATNYAVGDGPQNVAVGNFNGDANLDLAVANQFSDNVSVLLGSGAGAFGAATNYLAGDGPTGVAAGDFNGDADPDLAVANLNSDNVSILLGSSGGTFTAPTNYAVGDGPRSVAIGTFDQDLDLDLAIANGNSHNVSVLTGSVGGSFVGPATFATAANGAPQAIAAGLLSSDTKLDLAVPNLNTDNFSILLGQNEADLSIVKNDSPDPVAAGQVLTYTMNVGNVGPEGATGVTVSDPLPANSTWLSSSASQGSCSHDSTTNTVTCALGALGVGAQATVTITVAPHEAGTITNTATVSSSSADANQADNSNSEQTQVQITAPPFSAATNYPTGDWPADLVAADFNGDSDPDLATTNYSIHGASVLLGAAGATFAAPAFQPINGDPWPLVSADFNGDTDPDLAVGNTGFSLPKSVSVLLGGTAGSFGAPTYYTSADVYRGIATADFNGDSDPDLATTSSGNAGSILLGSTGGTFVSGGSISPGPSPSGIATGDFNGDSDPDLVVANADYPPNAGVSILLGAAGASFTGPTKINIGGNLNVAQVAVGHFNGDSDPDLAVSARDAYSLNGGKVVVLLGSAGGTFGSPTTFNVGDGARGIAVGDLNGDADPDLVVANQVSDSISILLGATAGSFAGPINLAAHDNPIWPVIGDFDGDSDRDIAVTNNDSDDLSVFVNGTVPSGPSGYARPKSASPNSIRLVPAFEQCTAPNETHGPPLAVNSCNPPQESSGFLTVGAPDANGKAANSTGLLTAKVLTEAPIDPNNGDQSDVQFTVSITDVRQKNPALDDYGGELRATFPLRLTDRLNGPGTTTAATATDVSFGFSFSCTPTAATNIGSTCSAATTADAVMPGVTPELKRAVWQLGQVQVFDGGGDADGDTTGDNTLFEVQGIYAP